MLRIITVLTIGALLSACASKKVSPDYSAYLAHAKQREESQTQQARQIADAKDCPAGDGSCVVAAKALAAMALQSNAQNTITPPRQRDWAEKVGSILTGVGPLAGAYVSIKSSQHQRDVQIANYEYLSKTTNSAFGFMSYVTTNSKPNITVTGDFTTGTKQVGDVVIGDGNATRDAQIGDSVAGDGNATRGSQVGNSQVGDNAGRDNVGRDVIHDSEVGSGNAEGGSTIYDSHNRIGHDQWVGNTIRTDSPGPIDNSDPGDDCKDNSCNPITPEGK